MNQTRKFVLSSESALWCQLSLENFAHSYPYQYPCTLLMICYIGYVLNKLLENTICFHETKFLQVDHDVTFGKI